MTLRLEDQNRRDINFRQAKVKDVLPEYFLSDYPTLVTFMEKYHDFLDSEGSQQDFKIEIDNLFSARDINQTSLDNLDLLIGEIGDGLQSSTFFQQPRLMTKLLANFYRVKGTRNSAEGFFRGFYNEEATVEYPKKNILTINDADNNFLSHHVGTESQKFIQDNNRFQIFSILVKSGISISDYENLYKKLVHPAGFHFAAEVVLVQDAGDGTVALTGVDSDEIRGISDVGPVLVDSAVFATDFRFGQLTGLLDSEGVGIRVTTDQYLSTFETITLDALDEFYTDVKEVITPNSFTMDDSATVDSASRPDTTITLETMDETIYTRYTSDSAV